MTRRERIDAFEAWLRANGTADEIAAFDRSMVEGLVAFAGATELTREHIDQSVRFARESGVTDLPRLELLGALLLRFDTRPLAAEPVVEAPPPLLELIGLVDEPAAAPAPVAMPTITIRGAKSPSTGLPRVTPAEAGAGPGPSPMDPGLRRGDGTGDDGPVDGGPDRGLRDGTGGDGPVDGGPDRELRDVSEVAPSVARPPPSRRGAVLAGIAVAAIIGVVIAIRAHPATPARAPSGAGPVAAAAPTALAPGVLRLRDISLAGTFPAGWHEVTGVAGGDRTLVVRGADTTDPDDGVYLSLQPATGELAVAAPTDTAFTASAHVAERRVIAQLATEHLSYSGTGCTMVPLAGGVRAAVCRGVATRGALARTVQLFLRRVGAHQVVALFVATDAVERPLTEAAAIVASLVLTSPVR